MSEKEDVFESLKQDTKELNKLREKIERLKEDLNIINKSSNAKED